MQADAGGQSLAAFPDYFKSELMETILFITGTAPPFFPDYFKSELMETITACIAVLAKPLSRLLQIGINGNMMRKTSSAQLLCLSRLLQIGINGNEQEEQQQQKIINFPDYFKSELMETQGTLCLLYCNAPFPITSNRN